MAQRRFPCVSGRLVGQVFDYTAKKKESLHSVSAKYGVDSRIIAEENDLPLATRLQPGQTVHIDNRHVAPCDITDGILVNLPQRMLFFYKDDKLQTSYPIAVGKPTWRTPTGGFQVLRLTKDPVWTVPESIQDEMEEKGVVVKDRVPPGPHNPLGDYWMGLTIPGIGIHATNAPVSIYSYRTHGCVRLQPANAKDLFHRITPGTPGMIVYEPVIFATTGDGEVFLEVDLDIYKKGKSDLGDVKRIADSARIANLVDWNSAAAVVKNHDGLAHEVGARK